MVMKLRSQMILLIAGPTLAIYIVILGLAGLSLHAQSRHEAERAMSRLAASYAATLDGYLREAARVADSTAQSMRVADRLTDEELYQQLEQEVGQMPLIYGACLAFEPGTRKAEGVLFAPYVCRAPDGLRRMDIDRSVYDWYADPLYTWFSEPKRLERNVWSPPYFDEGAGNILMSTYSARFFRADGAFGGIATVDIDLPNLRATVGSEINEELDFVILDADGRYVYHPDATRIMSRTVAEYAAVDGRQGLGAIVPRLLSGQAGAAWIDGWETDQSLGVFYTPVRSTGWVFACRMPAAAVLADARRRMLIGGSALIVALLLTGGCIYLVAGKISAPIAALEEKVTQVSLGNLEARIDEAASTVEIQRLAGSFNRMTADLRANVERLVVEKSARERIERDLDLARTIQQGSLPTVKPDLPGYDIAGWSAPADKTGGDYYDWQVLPEARLFVSLADVTGHGVGPALVTAVCRAYARASFAIRQDLGGFLDRLNELLVLDLPQGRFVTFVGLLLDADRHTVQILSAGHAPVFRYIAAQGELVQTDADELPLGLTVESSHASPPELLLEPGDFILLVTDGLFEWMNASGQQFGISRLRQAALELAGETAEELIRALYARVQAFVGDTPQQDDVTVVVLRRTGRERTPA
jgi:sigma-B regulation protein RsbU (phosphoserine phosphatase)